MAETSSAIDNSSSSSVKKSAFSAKAIRNSAAGTTAPFTTCTLVVIVIGTLLIISGAIGQLGSYLAIFVALFAFEWFNIHFIAMTRRKRAMFNIANVLETYQPRARTHGHLFIPDPPTPAVKIADDDGNHDMPKEKNAFMNARDSHYENMYQKAIQMAKEMEQLEKNGASPTMDIGQDVELKPAHPEEDKKASEEKAKKDKAKYDADMSKPFSC